MTYTTMGCSAAAPSNEPYSARWDGTEQFHRAEPAIPTMLQYRNMKREDAHNFKINSISESDDKIRLDIDARKSNLSVLLRNADGSRYSFEQNAIVCMIDSAMSSKLDE